MAESLDQLAHAYLRLRCLELALGEGDGPGTAGTVLERARSFAAFVESAGAVVAPAPADQVTRGDCADS